jgi:hypothetical protein
LQKTAAILRAACAQVFYALDKPERAAEAKPLPDDRAARLKIGERKPLAAAWRPPTIFPAVAQKALLLQSAFPALFVFAAKKICGSRQKSL